MDKNSIGIFNQHDEELIKMAIAESGADLTIKELGAGWIEIVKSDYVTEQQLTDFYDIFHSNPHYEGPVQPIP